MQIEFRNKAQFNADAGIVVLTKEQVKKNNIGITNKKIQELAKSVIKAKQFSGDNGAIFPLIYDNKAVLLTGIGKTDDISWTSLRITLRKALLSAYLKDAHSIEAVLPADSEKMIVAAIEAGVIGTYVWDKYKQASKDTGSKGKGKKLCIVASSKNVYAEAVKVCQGVNFARNLVNENADIANASFIEKTIKDIVKGSKDAKLEILGEKEMRQKGLNLHLAVNKGSVNPPRLIIVKYAGAGKSGDYTALVGKGITFDTGGLNLKPTNYIETMRTDMSGAAAVIGTLKAAVDLKLKKNIIFAVGVAENAIGSKAYKPGDVFKSYSGKTVEILNTDAEGRLVLADAISYVIKNYKPAKLIDLATLTGACVVALGHDYCGLVTPDDKLARQLVHSSNETDDRIWRLPVYPELKDSVKSKIADIANIGFPRGAAGALTAAEFLHQFAGGTRWAHLDIAGTAFVDGEGRMYYGHGATGFGVRLLTHYLMHN